MTSSVSNIKRAQKESLLFKVISKLFMKAGLDDARLRSVFVNRVKLSPDKSTATVYFYTDQGQKFFDEILDVLKLYKPSLRKSLASEIKSRYVPELIFKFDNSFEKQIRIDQLLDNLDNTVDNNTDNSDNNTNYNSDSLNTDDSAKHNKT